MENKEPNNNPQDEQKKANPNKEKTDVNLEEMGADQYDYGTGGPGAGRDDSSVKSDDKITGDDVSENKNR